MQVEESKRCLIKLGAIEEDMDALLEYTENAFLEYTDRGSDELSPRWFEIWSDVQDVCHEPPALERFESAAGPINIIYPNSVEDFESILRNIVYKGREATHIEKMGASFVSGRTLRFIVLSGKPYSGIPSEEMGLDEEEWAKKSMIIRKHHECAHYYTKRFFGISRNNLHDELIADFCGLYAAFGEYRAVWFMRFLQTRLGIYTKGLSRSASGVVEALAGLVADGVQRWSKTEEFMQLDEPGQIRRLVAKGLLEYVL